MNIKQRISFCIKTLRTSGQWRVCSINIKYIHAKVWHISLYRYFQGTSVIVRAIKNIHHGEMIAENYGQIFTQTPRAERQASLKSQYKFDCVCVPCTEDWPLFKNMHQGIMRFRCATGSKGGEVPKCNNVICVPTDTSDFIIQCPACKQYTNILKGLKVLQVSIAVLCTC
jgi:hypothetical protein